MSSINGQLYYMQEIILGTDRKALVGPIWPAGRDFDMCGLVVYENCSCQS